MATSEREASARLSKRYGASFVGDPPMPQASRDGPAEPPRERSRSSERVGKAATITTGRIEVGGFSIVARDELLSVEDRQATPVTRVKVGKLGTGVQDYGIEVYDASGTLVLSATGLGTDIGGWNITSSTLESASANIVLDASNETITVGSGVTLDGAAGSISATAGDVGGWSLTATDLTSGSFSLESDTERLLIGSATAPLSGAGVFLGLDGSNYEFRAGDPSGKYIHWTGTDLTIQGAVLESPASGSHLGLLGWSHDLTFSASDHNTVAWTSGTITFESGESFSINSGNTGNMTATTYVYLDKGVSQTALQTTTTAGTATGANKVLVAVAKNVGDTAKNAEFQVFGGSGEPGVGKLFTANEIAANTITFNEISGNTITGNEIDTLHISGKAATFDQGTVGGWTMASGHLVSGSLKLDSGAEQILVGNATAPLSGVGIFIGDDGNAVGDYDLRAGDPAGDHIHWDASVPELTVTGDITATTISADSGTIGGWSLTSTTIESGSVTLDSSAEQILLGSATAPLTGTGIFLGNDGSGNYDFRAGDPTGEFIHWDESTSTFEIKAQNFTASEARFNDHILVGDSGSFSGPVARFDVHRLRLQDNVGGSPVSGEIIVELNDYTSGGVGVIGDTLRISGGLNVGSELDGPAALRVGGAIGLTGKLHLDGGGVDGDDTWIDEVAADHMALATGGIRRLELLSSGAILNQSGDAPSTNPAKVLVMGGKGSEPSGMGNDPGLYGFSGELKAIDSADNTTTLSPHDEAGFWVQHHHVPKRFGTDTEGRRVYERIHVERLLGRMIGVINELADAAGISGVDRQQYFERLVYDEAGELMAPAA